jgi:hypothetical protein
MKKVKWSAAILLVCAMVLGLTSSIFALDNVKDDAALDKVMSLMSRDIVKGDGAAFHAEKNMTNAEGVQMIVKGMDLSLAAFQFIKEPLASDYFENMRNDVWYSQAFVIAAVNGLELSKDIDPKAEMTREAFAYHLITAMNLKGEFAFTKMYFQLSDEDQLNPDYNHALQLLLNGRMTELDEEGNFRPKDAITRGEAAVILYNMIEHVERNTAPIPDDGVVVDVNEVTYVVEAVNSEINKVTLSWGEQPNPGYGLSVASILFKDGNIAEIQYSLHYPLPDRMYPQVITTPTAVTYVPSAYDVQLAQAE